MAIHGGVYLTLSVLGFPAAASAFLVASPLPSSASPATALGLYRDGGSFVGRGGEGHDSSPPRFGDGAPLGPASADSGDTDDVVADDGGENDAAGATLGDIMAGPLVPMPREDGARSRRSPPPPSAESPAGSTDGLVTRDGGDIAQRFPGCGFRPMERVALTANGNLQRVLSSYYDCHVTVSVDSCVRRRRGVAEREVGEASPAAREALGRFDPRHAAGGGGADGGHGVTWDRIASIRVSDRTVCRASKCLRLCVRASSSPLTRIIETIQRR